MRLFRTQKNCLRNLALIGLSNLLLLGAARAQNCSVSLADGPGIPDEKLVHLGDTVHFFIHMDADPNTCKLDGGTNWVILPDGTVHVIIENYNKTNCGSDFQINCPLDAGCVGDVPTEIGPSGFLRFKYGPIQPADVGRILPQYTTGRGSVFTAQLGLPLAGQIWIGAITDARSTDCADPATHDKASGQGVGHVTIVTPAISVTKECVTNCPPTNSAAYNAPIQFRGTVCNTGDIALTNVMVTDSVIGAVIVYSNMTSLGNPFPTSGGGRLMTNECVNYTGSFPPSGNLCGPFPDTVVACGTDQSSLPKTVCATNSATCTVCAIPAITVSKFCPPTPTQPGTPLVFSGVVSNAGNVPLTNVTVLNNQPTNNTPVFGPITLDVGQFVFFTNSYIAPADSCGPYPDTLTAFGTSVCLGSVTNTDSKSCPGTNSPAIIVSKSCPPGPIQPGQTLTITGTVTNIGNITLTNVTVTNTIAALGGVSRRLIGPLMLVPGAGTNFSDSYIVPLDSCGPYRDTVFASGADKCFGSVVTSSDFKDCPGTNSPSVIVSKSCPPGPIQPGQMLTITGTVTNNGNITLTNVTVTNVIAAINASRAVFGPTTLAPGAGATFSDSYLVPLDSCGPYRDTVLAAGADKCFGRIVTASDFKDCPGTNSPAIVVSKSCPPAPTPPGGTLTISGSVSNSGNITLINVTVTNVIAATQQSPTGEVHLVLGPISLAPGAVRLFTDSYVVPTNSCGPYHDTVVAQGADKCFGRIVTASAFRDCPGITTPRLALFKHCPPSPVPPGSIATFSGTVSNAGNISLTNVLVFNNRPTNNTPLYGPITLAPGEFRNFTGTELVPANCCTYFDELTASGASVCTGSNVTASASAACPTLLLPAIAVTKSCYCPSGAVPLGQPMQFTGTVSNRGNITLVNVTVIDNRPTNNTPVFGPLTLAPGETADFSGSFIVPLNICDTSIADTVTANGYDVCQSNNVTAMATAVCPITPNPRLVATKQCPPGPVAPGDLLVYTGSVSNAGGVIITNIVVVDDRPAPNTLVTNIGLLAPGQSTNFTGSYRAPYDCCGPCVDTVTATGQDVCSGSNITATASVACPRITTPAIKVTRDCPPSPVTTGDLVFFNGVVTNAGNATLANVKVVDDQAGTVLDNTFLSPGEAVAFTGMYLVTNCGPNVPSGVTATANDLCTSAPVTNRFSTTCSVLCTPSGPVIFGAKTDGPNFIFSFTTETNRTYTIWTTTTLTPPNWQSIATFAGDGSTVSIEDALVGGQKYYRVSVE